MTLSFLTAFCITNFGILIIVRASREKGLFDNPNGRTSHDTPTPNLGGVAVFIGIILSVIIFAGFASSSEMKYIIAGMMMIFFLA